MIENTSPYFLPVAPTGNPPEGFVYVQRTTSHFRRSVNGAWLSNGQTTENYKVPVTEVAGWLSPGACGYVWVLFPDGSHLSVDGGNTPVRGSGWGPYGYITVADMWGNERQEGVSLSTQLPNVGLSYYGARTYTPEQVATFKPYVFEPSQP